MSSEQRPTTAGRSERSHSSPRRRATARSRFLRAMIFSGELRPGRQASARARPGRPPGHLAHDPAPGAQGAGEHRLHRHDPGSHGGSRVSDAESLFACWNAVDAPALRRARRHLRVPHHRRDETGRSGRREAHRGRPGGHASGGRASEQPAPGLVVAVPRRHGHPSRHRPGGPQPPAGAGHAGRSRRPLRAVDLSRLGAEGARGARDPPRHLRGHPVRTNPGARQN